MSGNPSNEPKAALDAALHPDTLPAELRLLARSPWPFVQAAVARHPNTEPDVLLRLTPQSLGGPYTSLDLAVALAANLWTPAEALSQLATLAIPLLNNHRHYQGVFELGVKLCRHPATSFEAIQRLLTATTATTRFRKVVARETRRNDVVTFLLNDRSERVREIARRTQTILTGH